jgi:starvation-inducible DNA-binding protein
MDMMPAEMGNDAKAMCAKCLTMAFADSYVMYYRAHAYHWNVKGPEFSQFHDFFEMIYADVYGSVDAFAENIRKLGPDAPSDLGDILAHTAIDEVFVAGDPIEMTRALYAANEVTIASINDAFKAAEAADEQGIADFLAGRDDMHKKWRWQMSTIIGADATLQSVSVRRPTQRWLPRSFSTIRQSQQTERPISRYSRRSTDAAQGPTPPSARQVRAATTGQWPARTPSFVC